MKGWIKLHRSIMCSDTFSKLTPIQQLIAIYIILNTNHEDGVWYDKYKDIEVPVKRGQLIVSRNKIANEWFKGDKDVTEQKVRTTLKKLEKSSFLTIESTNSYTLLEVLNYNVYQDNGNETNQQFNQVSTKSQPSLNQVSTTNKNDKNNKEIYSAEFEEFWELYPNKKGKKKSLDLFQKARNKHEFKTIMDGLRYYINYVESIDWLSYKHPTTFLNQESFLDEYTTSKKNERPGLTPEEIRKLHKEEPIEVSKETIERRKREISGIFEVI